MLIALPAALLQNIFTSMTVKNDLKSNVKSAQNYSTSTAALLIKLNSGAPIATTLSSFGNIKKTAPSTNVTMINALPSSITSINSISLKKPYVKQNLPNSNSVTNIANITLPMINSNILPLINLTLSSISTIQ